MALKGQKFKKHNSDIKEIVLDRYLNGESSISLGKEFGISQNTIQTWGKKIKYPEIFELDIRKIENEEIPNLFNGAHYLVQPYRVVSQSGPTKVAFRYNLPILCSNLPGFTDEVIEGVNGYYFEKGNTKDLADKMRMLIKSHTNNYQKLLESQKKYTEETYSEKILVGQYINMFNEISQLI